VRWVRLRPPPPRNHKFPVPAINSRTHLERRTKSRIVREQRGEAVTADLRVDISQHAKSDPNSDNYRLGHEPRPAQRVRRIAHASFETPDLERQVAYYTEVLGLVLVEKTADTAWLATGGDHHSVILHRGTEPACKRLAFQTAPRNRFGCF